MIEALYREDISQGSPVRPPHFDKLTGLATTELDTTVNGIAKENRGRLRFLKRGGQILAEAFPGFLAGAAIRTAVSTGLIAAGFLSTPAFPLLVGGGTGMIMGILNEAQRQRKKEITEDKVRLFINAASRGAIMGLCGALLGGLAAEEIIHPLLERISLPFNLTLPSFREIVPIDIQAIASQTADEFRINIAGAEPVSFPMNEGSPPEVVSQPTVEPTKAAPATLPDAMIPGNPDVSLPPNNLRPRGVLNSLFEERAVSSEQIISPIMTQLSSLPTLQLNEGSSVWDKTVNLLQQISPNTIFSSSDIYDLSEVILEDNKLFEPDWVSPEKQQELIKQGLSSSRNIIAGSNLQLTEAAKKAAFAIVSRN